MKKSIYYNVTVHVENTVAEDWVQWMKDKHIPDVMSTQMFHGYHFSKIMADTNDGSSSFAVLYIAKDKDHLKKYQDVFAPALQQEHSEKYKDKAFAFRTLMEHIDSK